MGDLRDKLLKAGLVTEEQAKKAEAKAQPPERGGAGRRPEQRGGKGRGPEGERARERPAREVAAPVSLTKEESQRRFKLAQAGKVEGKTRGNRRWYFVSRAGRVPYLELSDEAVKDLEQGRIAIAESERGEAWLVTGECARQLVEVDPGWVRTG